jgi:hypothetical protein
MDCAEHGKLLFPGDKTVNRGFDIVACACPHQWLYLFPEAGAHDGGVVYSEVHNRVAGLDATGVAAFRAFDAGVTLEDLGRSRTDSNASTSGDGLEAVYKLSQGIFPTEETPARWPALDASKCIDTAIANIEIDGIPISLQYPQGPVASLCRDYFQNCSITDKPARCGLSVHHTQGSWAIYVNGQEFLPLLREEQLGLGLLHATRSLLYAEGDYDVAFHAAMVAHADCGIMLSAPRECGKSTLAAYLITRGFDLLTDEPALLILDKWSVKPLRVPISLKQGSWPALQQHWPDLLSALVHFRSDGIKIRLAHPSKERYSSQPRPLTCIVFPYYSPACEARIYPISPFHAIRLLTDGGVLFAKHIARDSFEKFLKLVCLTPAYRIHYASLQQAEKMLHGVACVTAGL